ncbi:DUF333 domain-containing protein [Affinibrenneria salicis]|uniref:DUF333 domain-containing protein n=1 Tax=Affinibrenneria salicis TaxID=2590031 RepID=A0A5J5G4X0_9GAMM|nr:DUF333 domain-containing protein [Affinibrenneria salicis]KAA9001982.1 DUF333 domain-containing protein [Affinibrenneria salicis]
MAVRHWLLASAALWLVACSSGEKNIAVSPSPKPTGGEVSDDLNAVTLLNSQSPAAANCSLAGGTMAMVRQLNGSGVGMCQLTNGKRCDERSIMNGSCPTGW